MINQLVFGYDEGHRLLGGSTPVPSATLSLLLGATDARPGGEDDRLVTGLPLESDDLYALSATWSAPELPRPGAVWSHVLLIRRDLLMERPNIASLFGLLRRPTPSSLLDYAIPLRVPHPKPSSLRPSRYLLEEVLSAVYEPGQTGLVVSSDLRLAETVLALIWSHQWPALRANFSFRTRDASREMRSNVHVVIARRAKGARAISRSDGVATWISQLAEGLLEPSKDSLVSFLSDFGPCEQPKPEVVSPLASLYLDVREESATRVRDALEDRYPTSVDGTELKSQLFGQTRSRWWTVSDPQSVLCLLGARRDAWDVRGLRVSQRLSAALAEVGCPATVEALAEEPAPTIRQALLSALVRRRRPEDVPVVAQSQIDLAIDLVRAAPNLAQVPKCWEDLTSSQVRSLIGALQPLPDGVLLAVARAGQAKSAAQVVGGGTLLRGLLRSGAVGLALRVVRDGVWFEGLRGNTDDDEDDAGLLLLEAAAGPSGPPDPRLLQALENTRTSPNELWIRAAVKALVSASERAQALRVVFGPLHAAMTANRIPSDCWRDLDAVLPDAPDPALRLRLLLLETARKDDWTEDELFLALRDAGPYVTELTRDMDPEDGWWAIVAEALSRAMGPHR